MRCFFQMLLFGLLFFQNKFLTAQPRIQQMRNDSNKINAIKPKSSVKTDAFMENLLGQFPQYFSEILADRAKRNVQIIYTQINRGKNGTAALTDYYFNVAADKYFYPASTVKLPIVLLALQRLNELKDKGIDKFTTMITESGYGSQTAVYNDPTEAAGRPYIAHYIKKILMVSDNDAYNRLYEFLGQDYINNELQKKGYKSAQILHRLNIALSDEENKYTNPVKFVGANQQTLYEQPLRKSFNSYPLRKDFLGKAYYADGKLVNTPMNFSQKNRLSLEDLHKMLISIVFPDKVPVNQRFNISEDDRLFVLKYMSQLPSESITPNYDTANYFDTYSKFLLFGSEKKSYPKNIRVFNKVGNAYGSLLDVAYIVDYEKDIEFFVSAVIDCNSDDILNDDQYDYDTIGLPFMRNIGKMIYDYEAKRIKKEKPDFSGLRFNYDKMSVR